MFVSGLSIGVGVIADKKVCTVCVIISNTPSTIVVACEGKYVGAGPRKTKFTFKYFTREWHRGIDMLYRPFLIKNLKNDYCSYRKRLASKERYDQTPSRNQVTDNHSSSYFYSHNTDKQDRV